MYPYDDDEQDASLLPRPNPVRSIYAGTAVAPPAMTSPTGAVPPPPAPPVQPTDEDYPETDASTFQGAAYRKPSNPMEERDEFLKQPRPAPSIWSRIASGALGGMAGYLNASGKRGVHVDPQMIQDAAHNMQYGAYDRQKEAMDARAANYQKEKQLELTEMQRQAQLLHMKSVEEDLKDRADARTEKTELAKTAEQRKREEDEAKAAKFQLDANAADAKVYTPSPTINTTVPAGGPVGQDTPLSVGPPPDPDNLIVNPFKPKQRFIPGPSKREQEEAKLVDLPKPIADKFQITPGTKVPQTALPAYLTSFDTLLKNEQASPEAQVAVRTKIADSLQLKPRDREVYIATGRIERPPVFNINAAAKEQQKSSEDKVLESTGGDWNKVIAGGYDNVKALAGKDAAAIWEKAQKNVRDAQKAAPKLPAQAQTRVASADATIQQVQRAINAIDTVQKKYPDYFGSGLSHPLNAMKRGAATTFGLEPGEIGAADSALESVAALQPGQHGFRSRTALSDFKKALGIDPRTMKPDGSREWLRNPEKAKAALREILVFNETLKGAIKNQSGVPQQPQTQQQEDPLELFK